MALSPRQTQWARYSLVLLWLWTAAVSAWQAPGLSTQLLQASAYIPPTLYPWLIWIGIGLDAVLGVVMLCRPRPWVFLGAWVATLSMTLIGTWVDPSLWLHPLGPMSKNLPILALLWMLARPSS